MHEFVTYERRPDFHDIILVEGLPGVGNVGKIAADFVADKLGAVRVADIFSEELPPQVLMDDECVGRMLSHKLFHCRIGEQDVVFLLGDVQAMTAQGQFALSKYEFDLLLGHGIKEVITLGGYGLGTIVTDPRVIGVVTDAKLKPGFEEHGVSFVPGEPAGGVVGAAAVLLGLAREFKIDGICIIGETSGAIEDHKSASCVIKVMSSILGVEMDLSDLQESVNKVDQINNEVQTLYQGGSREDLSYIG
jgi:hypothetical protein